MQLSLKLALCLLAACSFAGLLAPFYWFFDLFNHFRLHAMLASLLLLVAALFLSRKRAVFALGLLIANAMLFYIPLHRSGGITEIKTYDAVQVKIVFANVYTPNTHYLKAMEITGGEMPDIIALTETDESWVKHYDALENRYRHSIKRPQADSFGLAVYSKLPFRAEIVDVGDYRLPLALLDFEKFRLIVAHAFPPLSSQSTLENRRYIETIARHAKSSDKPVIVAGDLNSTLWSEAIRPLFDAGLKRINRSGVAYTWPVQMPALALQIDHFFAKTIAQADFKVLADIGSDHYPIAATISIH